MHIPSKRIQQEMFSEHASIWYTPANGGEENALLLKLPTASIKALISGSELRLTFGRNGSHLCTGFRVFDIPDAPISITGAQHEKEEHDALLRFLSDRSILVFLFNEMDVSIAWTNLQIGAADALAVLGLIGDPDVLYSGSFTADLEHSIDCFCLSIDSTSQYPGAVPIPFVEVETEVEPWRITQAAFVGNLDSQIIKLADTNEGEMFERTVWSTLEPVFPLTLHKGPEVEIGSRRRELTDVLAFYENGCFLIEAKDLAVIQSRNDRSLDRRIAGVQKQAKTAIRQLIGAAKAVARGEKIFDLNGNELSIDRTCRSHCIVLVTELMHGRDWGEVETQLIEAMSSTGCFFHLLDLDELVSILKGSSGQVELLDYNLINRCELFAEVKSVHIRSRPAIHEIDQHTTII